MITQHGLGSGWCSTVCREEGERSPLRQGLEREGVRKVRCMVTDPLHVASLGADIEIQRRAPTDACFF